MQDNQRTATQAPTERQLLVLMFGGCAGLILWGLSLVLAYAWRGTLLGGLDAWQGKDWWQLWVCLLTMFGGLAIMFVSLLPLRAVERSNAALRRLLYGYNAVLTGLLLLAILMVGNVLVYNYLTPSFDWTQSGIYTLSERSKNILRALDKPTKIYAVVFGSEIGMREVRTLLDNCRAVNEKVQVEYVDPDLDIPKMRKLMSDYQFNEREGLIVVYGEEGKTFSEIIKSSDLFAADPTSPRGRFNFKGEDALMTTLSYLEGGKTRPVVYFTQGNGEPDLNDASSSQEGQGLGALRERLQKGNYEVKGLQFSPVADVKSTNLITVVSKVPDDAELVVVAGPRHPLPDFAVKALREYVNPTGDAAAKKKGKLVVLLDAVLDPGKNMVQTGLEGLLAELDVQVANDRVLSLPTNLNRGDPLAVAVVANPQSRNPIPVAFREQGGGFILMPNARPVQKLTSNPNAAAGRYVVEPLMVAPSRLGSWVETNLRADPGQLVNDLMNNEQELRAKLGKEPPPVAVAVGEPQSPSGNDPHAFMRQPQEKPRAVVFGSASFVCNRYVTERSPLPNYDLFSSAIDWLRERPSSIGVEPKKRNIFALNVSDEVISRMRWLPVTFMVITIIGLGTGVWLIRRR